MALQRIAKKTLSDEVYDQLSREIVAGRIGAGNTLPAERELCATLGVNRGAIREALKRLAQAGLVEIQQGGGTTVLDYRRSAGLGLLSHLLLKTDGTVDLDVARSVMEMRAVLAPDIARLCAERRGRDVPRQLKDVLARMEAAGDDLDALQVLSLEFWDVLVRGANNVAYELAFNTLRETYSCIRAALVQVLAEEVRDLESYSTVIKAVVRGDAATAALAAAMLVDKGTRAIMDLVELLDEGPAGAALA